MKVRGARGWEDKRLRVETYLCLRGSPPQGSRGSLRLAPEPSQCPPRAGKCHPHPGGRGLKVPPLGGSVPPGAHHLLSVTPCQAEVTPLGNLDQLD